MPQECQFCLEQMAFLDIEGEIGLVEPLKHCLKVKEMLLFSPGEDNYVIDVNKAGTALQIPQDCLHQSLEGGAGVAQPEWHHLKMEEASMGDHGSLPFAVLAHDDLPIATLEIQ